LARKARQTLGLSHLRDILKSWKYLDTHGEALLSVIQTSCRHHLLQLSQASTDNSNQSQQSTEQQWLISDTPSRSASQSIYCQTPYQLSITPVLDLTMSAQTISSSLSSEPATPATPVIPGFTGKRRPLGPISGNKAPKRGQQSKTEMSSTTRL
jgi:hypothetical protein